jgi:hypothetical protein
MKRSREPEEYLESDFHTQVSSISQEVQPSSKYTELDPEVEKAKQGTNNTVMRCSLPPHKESLSFTSYQQYESHYNNFHTHRCLECRKNFPSEYLLEIHIEECHDPLVVIKRDRGEHTYSCFVEGCERKCLTHQKRRLHMIDKHMYPKNFFFGITKDGIDGRRSLLNDKGHRRRRSSTASHSTEAPHQGSSHAPSDAPKSPISRPSTTRGKDAENGTPEKADEQMEDLTGAMSSLRFIPPSVRFGRGRPGFAKQ